MTADVSVKKTALLNLPLTSLRQPLVRSQAHPHRRLPSIQWFIPPQGEPFLTQPDQPKNWEWLTYNSQVTHHALKHERQGLCHHYFTQIIAWLCWINPAAICPVAEVSKTCLVSDWQCCIVLKEHRVALTYQGLPEVCVKGIALFSTQRGHSVIITQGFLTRSFTDSLSMNH